MRIVALVAAVGLALALGCSRDDAREATEAVKQKTEEAAAAAARAARETADEAGAAADRIAEETQRTGEDLMGYTDPVARCRELAAQEAWDQALEPCTAAHAAEPDDMAIEHALQQAKAAAAQ